MVLLLLLIGPLHLFELTRVSDLRFLKVGGGGGAEGRGGVKKPASQAVKR